MLWLWIYRAKTPRRSRDLFKVCTQETRIKRCKFDSVSDKPDIVSDKTDSVSNYEFIKNTYSLFYFKFYSITFIDQSNRN